MLSRHPGEHHGGDNIITGRPTELISDLPSVSLLSVCSLSLSLSAIHRNFCIVLNRAVELVKEGENEERNFIDFAEND